MLTATGDRADEVLLLQLGTEQLNLSKTQIHRKIEPLRVTWGTLVSW